MNYANIATILNTVLVPNALGQEETIKADLSNLTDVGTKISAMTAAEVKDYAGKLVVGVTNMIDVKRLAEETFGLVLDTVEFGGVLQRVKAKALTKAYNTDILTLEDFNSDPTAPDYNDGHFYGVAMDSRVYTKDVGFKVPVSLPVEMFKKAFKSPMDMDEYLTSIKAVQENTIIYELNTLARNLLCQVALNCNAGNRKISLISTYNTQFGLTGTANAVTYANWKANADFKTWAAETIVNIKKYVKDLNDKYNDGETVTFTTDRDARSIFLTEFDTALEFNKIGMFNKEIANIGEHYTVNYWQNPSEDILPYIFDAGEDGASVHDSIVSDDVTLNHVVGIIYDRYTCGITTRLSKVTTDYIAGGDFVQSFAHNVKRYWLDSRETGIIITL